MCTSIEHDLSIVKEVRQMIKCQLNLYINMNEDLTRELKAAYYKFARFLEGVETRSSMGEALIVVAKFSLAI